MKTLSSRVVYQNRWMSVREDQVERNDGSPGIYAFVDKPTAAMIIPLDGSIEDGSVYLIEQFRYPVGKRFLEFPAGAWEDRPDAAPEDLARGELREETGLIAGSLEHVGFLYFAYGMSNQGYHVYLASDLVQGEAEPEHTEQDLLVKRVAVEEFERLCRENIIRDSASIAAWSLLQSRWPSLKQPDSRLERLP